MSAEGEVWRGRRERVIIRAKEKDKILQFLSYVEFRSEYMCVCLYGYLRVTKAEVMLFGGQ